MIGPENLEQSIPSRSATSRSLAAIEKNKRRGLPCASFTPRGFGHGLRQRNPPGIKVELALPSTDPITPKRRKREMSEAQCKDKLYRLDVCIILLAG